MEQKLSKTQTRIIISLAQQKEDARKTYNDIIETEKEQLAMIAKYYDLPTANYSLKQAGDELVLFSEDPVVATPEHVNAEVLTTSIDEGKQE